MYTFRIDKITERGGKRELRTAQADFQLKATEAQMLDAIRTQLFQLRQAFASAMLARENLRLAESTQQQYEHTERLTEVKVTNGDVPGVELYRIHAGRLQYAQTVLQARTSYEHATSDILNLLGARVEQVTPRPKAVAQLWAEGRRGRRSSASLVDGGSSPESLPRRLELSALSTTVSFCSPADGELPCGRPDVIALRFDFWAGLWRPNPTYADVDVA